MNKVEIEKLFIESKGQPIILDEKELKMVDKIILDNNNVNLKLKFISTNSKSVQGVIIDCNGSIKINNLVYKNKIVLWENTAPNEIELSIYAKDEIFYIYNAWIPEDNNIKYWKNGSALQIEQDGNKKTYYCNDGYPEVNFNTLVFSIEFNS